MVVQSPTPIGLGRNGSCTSRGSQLPWALPFIFICCSLNDRRKAAHSFLKIGHLFSLFSCLPLARLGLLILLLLMSGNVHPNPCPIFPCSVCAGNVTWQGKSVQCCACSKWAHLRCSRLSLSKFRTLDCSHSWNCPPCCAPTCNTVTSSSESSDMYTSTVQSSSSSANAGGLQATTTELLHFLSSHPVDLICIQEANLNSSSSFRIPGFSVLHSHHTHSRSGIISRDTTHASGGVVIFVRQGLSVSEFSTSSLSSLDPYSDYVGINISLNNSSSLVFPNVYAPSIRSTLTDGRSESFSPSILTSSRNLFILGDFNCHHSLWDSRGEEVFDWVIFSDLLPLNDPGTPTFLHRSSGSCSCPDISFAPHLLLFLALGRCFRTWVLTIYQFFYLSLSPQSFAPTSIPLPSIIRKLAGMTLPCTLILTVLPQRNASFLSCSLR